MNGIHEENGRLSIGGGSTEGPSVLLTPVVLGERPFIEQLLPQCNLNMRALEWGFPGVRGISREHLPIYYRPLRNGG